MVCTHRMTEIDVAVVADGYCPLCQAAEIEGLIADVEGRGKSIMALENENERLRAAMRDSCRYLDDGKPEDAFQVLAKILNEPHAVGEYKADYTPLTESELTMSTGAEELLERSRPVIEQNEPNK